MPILKTFALCLVGWNLGWMDNIRGKMGWKTEFSSVWEWEENKKSGKPEENFLPRPTNFFPPEINERKLPHCYFTIKPSHLPSFMPFTYPTWRLFPTKVGFALFKLMLMPSQFFVKGVMFGWNVWKKKMLKSGKKKKEKRL